MLMIKEAAKLMRQSQYAVVLSGAGMSTESGLPDFRSHGGLWDGKKPEEISHYSAVGTPAFKRFFSKRMTEIQKYEPNKGHRLLAKWEKEGIIKSIITQNIDSYHQDAGSRHVIEMHGHLRYLICDRCEKVYDNTKYIDESDDTCLEEGCLGTVRPPVVLFGEYLPADAWQQAEEEIKSADLVLVLGTSLQVYPVNTLVENAYRHQANIILVTKSETPLDYMASVRIHESIGDTLQQIDKMMHV